MKDTAQQMLRACGISDSDRELIRLYGLHGKARADHMRAWFAAVDFEKLSPECVCMAAVVCSESGYEGAPDHLRPRLKGIIRYHRMLNSGLYAAMCVLVREYNKLGIDVLALKGTAIKTGYSPDFVRPMWDVDILVRPEDYRRALDTAFSLGYRGSRTPHSTDLHRGNLENIDLHCVYLRDLRSRKHRSYWPECSPVCWNDAEFFVPEHHALLLQLLANACTNFVQRRKSATPLRWVMDIDALLRSCRPDWNKLAALAKQLELETQTALVLAAYDLVLPGRVEPGIIQSLGSAKKAKSLLRVLMAYHRADEAFRSPPEGCSSLRLAGIHIRWLWLDCRTENPGSALHGLRCFPEYLRSELRVKSLLQLPAVAVRKFIKRRKQVQCTEKHMQKQNHRA